MEHADDFYFDELARVDMPTLAARGESTLLGDAAMPVSAHRHRHGDGVAGAYVLAAEIAAAPDDLAAALVRYEQPDHAVHRAVEADPRRWHRDDAAANQGP